MIGVRLGALWENELFGRVLDDMPDRYLVAESCVLTQMTKATNHLNKDLSFVIKPSQPCRTGPLPKSCNDTLTDTSIDVMQDLYPGDVVFICRLRGETLTKGVLCVLVASPVEREMGRPARKVVWLKVENIGQNGVRLKSIVLANNIGILFFHDSTTKV